jgi:hypothetical protein
MSPVGICTMDRHNPNCRIASKNRVSSTGLVMDVHVTAQGITSFDFGRHHPPLSELSREYAASARHISPVPIRYSRLQLEVLNPAKSGSEVLGVAQSRMALGTGRLIPAPMNPCASCSKAFDRNSGVLLPFAQLLIGFGIRDCLKKTVGEAERYDAAI